MLGPPMSFKAKGQTGKVGLDTTSPKEFAMRMPLRIAAVVAVVFQQTAALACTAFLAYDGKLALGCMNDQGLFFDGMMTDPLPLKKTEGKRMSCPRPS